MTNILPANNTFYLEHAQMSGTVEVKPKIRILHHMARSGGTIISRCLGCMKDVVLLSEIHPLALQCTSQYGKTFSPLHQAYDWFKLFDESEINIIENKDFEYVDIIDLIYKRATSINKILVVRDWSHLDFIGFPFIKNPSFNFTQAQALQEKFELVQIATVRDSIDQWLSLNKLAIMHEKIDLDFYLKGCFEFAKKAKEIGFIRYEDFTSNPAESMLMICNQLKIPFDGDFEKNWFDYHKITGDKLNESRKKISIPEKNLELTKLSKSFQKNYFYQQYCQILGYKCYNENKIKSIETKAVAYREENPHICILVNTYNHERYISQCLDSLVNQTMQPTIIKVFDDCSTDGSWEIIKFFKIKYPDLFLISKNEKNLGARKNGELLWSQIEGNYCAYIEGDDFWSNEKIESEYKALQEYPQAGAAYSNVAMTNEAGNVTHFFHDPNTDNLPCGNLFFRVATRNIFNRSKNCFRNYLFRTECYLSLNHQREKHIPSMGDYDLHLTFSARFPFAASKKSTPYVFYRNHEKGISKNKRDVQVSQMLIYEKHIQFFNDLLDKEHNFIVIFFQEANLSLMTDFFSEEKKRYYAPNEVIDRMIKKMKSFPRETQDKIWEIEFFLLFQIAGNYISNLFFLGKKEESYAVWEWCNKKNPNKLKSFIPDEIFEILEQKSRKINYHNRLNKLKNVLK